LIWLLGIIFFWQPVSWPTGAIALPRFQAHRGFRPKNENVVENTIAAFRRAKTAGAQMVECDVQITRDGQAVIFHDTDLKRLGGRADLVANCTAAQLKEWVGAPLLSELLNDSACPHLVNIELKTTKAFRGNGLELAVLAAVEGSKAQARIVFSSFNPFALRRMAKLAPNLPRALLVTGEKDKANKLYLRRMWLGAYCQAHMINVDKDMVTAANLDAWAERGLRAATWTVNNPEQAREFLAMGTVSVISDTIFSDEASI